MQIQSNEVEYCKLLVSYTADPNVVKTKRDEFVSSLRKTHVKGFRPGKAPDYAIKAVLGRKLDVYVAEKMKSQAFDDIIFETEIKPIGVPKFEDVKINGNNFSCQMTVFKSPEFELKDYKFEIPKPDINIDIQADVESTLEHLRIQLGDVEPYGDNDFVNTGDQITISFTATVDGEPFEEGSSEGQLYVVGQNLLPGFDDNLLGASAGETRMFTQVIPEGVGDLSGKTAQFVVNVIMGAKKIPCALDDEFAKKLGSENVQALRDQIQRIAEAKASQAQNLKVRQQVAARLVEDHDFKAPGFLVDMEAQYLALQNNIDWSTLATEDKEIFTSQAEKSVKLSLILNSVRDKDPETVLTDMEMQGALHKKAALQNKDPKQFLVEAERNGSLLGMTSALRDEYTLQRIVDGVKLVD